MKYFCQEDKEIKNSRHVQKGEIKLLGFCIWAVWPRFMALNLLLITVFKGKPF